MHSFDIEDSKPFELPPLTAPPTYFSGALPRDIIRALKRLDRRLELKWSPRFECWEVWHERNGKKYVFYRHTTPDGRYLEADSRLLKQIISRAMWTAFGQNHLRRSKQMAIDNASIDPNRDPEQVAWEMMRR